MLRERRAKPLEILHPQRHRSASRDAVGRIGEADEPLPLAGLEQLDERGEALVARLLRQLQLLEQRRGAPGRRGLDSLRVGSLRSSCRRRYGAIRNGMCNAFAPKPKRSFPRCLHMPRAIWSGAISFGLVNVPVRMYSAIEEKDLHFHLIHEPDNGRIGYQKFCKKEEKLVPEDEIVKAFETSKDKHVDPHRRGLRLGEGRGCEDDRHLRLRPLRRDRSDLLRPHLLPRAAGRCREGLRADARGNGAHRPGRDRQVRDARAAVPRLPARARRRDRAREDVLPR